MYYHSSSGMVGTYNTVLRQSSPDFLLLAAKSNYYSTTKDEGSACLSLAGSRGLRLHGLVSTIGGQALIGELKNGLPR